MNIRTLRAITPLYNSVYYPQLYRYSGHTNLQHGNNTSTFNYLFSFNNTQNSHHILSQSRKCMLKLATYI